MREVGGCSETKRPGKIGIGVEKKRGGGRDIFARKNPSDYMRHRPKGPPITKTAAPGHSYNRESFENNRQSA